MFTFVCCCVGFLTGLVGSIAGGGGFIEFPLLLLLGVPTLTAMGTHKFIICLGQCASVLNYARHGKVMWRLAAGEIVFGLVGCTLGVQLVLHMDPALRDRMLSVVLPVGMLALVVLQMRKRRPDDETWTPPPHMQARNAAVSGAVGVYEGLVGPGTGPLMIMGLNHFVRLPMLEASATARILTFCASTWVMCILGFKGNIDFRLGLPMAVCCVLGNVVGSQFAVYKGSGFVRKVLYVVLTVLAASMIWKYWLS